jgi:soluble lytic murein transglycosylase
MSVRSPAKARCVVAFLWSAVCVLAAVPCGAQAQDALAATRKQFLEAVAAVQPASQSPIQPGDEALRGYPLYPYLQSVRLQQALAAAGTGDSPADADVRDFLARHAGEPVANPLRRHWLTSLGRRELWAAYLAAAPESLSDPSLNCLALTARIETGRTQDLVPLVVRQWLTPDQLPADCERPFAWLRSEGALTDDLVEQRVRMSLAKSNARFARMIAASLPAPKAAPLLQWAALLEQPRREIDVLTASPATKVEPAALLAGWTKLVGADFDYARTRFPAFVKARKLDREAASPFALALALRLSWNRHPDALGHFARVSDADVDDVAREWHARAALWAGDWQGLAAVIAAMPPALAQTPRWKYWAARSAAATGNREAARALFVSILSADNYYSAMAAAHLGQTLTPNPAPVSADEAELSRIAQLPGFVRARELLQVGMRNEALAEWQHGVRALPTAVQPQVVHLGMRWQWYDVSIATATQQRIFDDYALLYPRPYDDDVRRAATAAALPTELVYGVLRQESLYRPDAVSSAGAVGLLQMLPETARRTARRAQHPLPRPADLLKPAINVRLGAAHLRELLDQFGGQVPLALAGYNAGPGAALRWLPDQAIDTDVWIENIPFNETRNYVQRILWHTVVFSWLGSGQPQATQAWLTEVSRSSRTGRTTAAGQAQPTVTAPGLAANRANPQ